MTPVQVVDGITLPGQRGHQLVVGFGVALVVAAGLLAIWLANIDATRPVPDGVRSPVSTAVLFVLIEVAFAGVGALLVARRTAPAIGWLLLAFAIVDGVNRVGEYWSATTLVARPGALPAGHGMAWLDSASEHSLPVLLAAIVLLFPTGQPPAPRWRWPLVLLAVGTATAFVSRALDAGPLSGVPFPVGNPLGLDTADRGLEVAFALAVLTIMVGMAGCVASLVPRYRDADEVRRRQLQWLAWSALLIAVVVPVVPLLPDPFTVLYAVTLAALPVAIGLAVLRVRLTLIDRLLPTTLVAFFLVATLALVYVAVVAGGGMLVGRGGDPWLVLAALVLMGVLLLPLRARADRAARRLLAGPPAKPADVLADLAVDVGVGTGDGAGDVDALLDRVARAVVEGTEVRSAEVWARVDDRLERAGSWPPGRAAPAPLPLTDPLIDPLAVPGADTTEAVVHDGRLVGALAVQLDAGRPLRRRDERLLDELAAAAGLVLENGRLIAELRASCQRLVEAQDAERRRIERDLHDGAQQRLQALSVQVRRIQGQLDDETPPDVAELLDQTATQLQEALDELRDLARGIHPAVLTAGGIEPALRSLADRAGLPVTVDGDVDRRLPEVIEATAYFAACEALTNAVRHSHASHVRIAVDLTAARLRLEIVDDGVGGAAPATNGGLTGLADRVAAVGGTLEVTSPAGGGTAVRVELPCASS